MRTDSLSVHYLIDFFGPERASELLADAGLLDDDGGPPPLVSKETVWQLCITNIDRHGDEGHGVLTRTLPKASWAMVVSAVNQMETLGGGLKRVPELVPVLQCGVRASLGYSARWAHLSFVTDETLAPTTRTERYLDLIATWFLCVLLWGAGEEFVPDRARGSALLDAEDGYMLAGLARSFERSGTGTTISFRLDQLAVPLGVRRYQGWATNETFVYHRLQALLGDAPPERAEAVVEDVRRLLAAADPSQPEVARALGYSVPTLQRRLAAAGTTFRELVKAVRSEQLLALLSTSASLDDIAADLGYSDRRSLTRACQDWFGTTPSALRRAAREPRGLVSALGRTLGA